jgi:hypothetical protein
VARGILGDRQVGERHRTKAEPTDDFPSKETPAKTIVFDEEPIGADESCGSAHPCDETSVSRAGSARTESAEMNQWVNHLVIPS